MKGLKELLGKIFGILNGMAAPTYEEVARFPVAATELIQRLCACLRAFGPEDERPKRILELNLASAD